MQPWSQPLLWKGFVATGPTTIFTSVMTTNTFINSNGNVRLVIPPVYLAASGAQVRITFTCPTASGAYPIEHCYIGHAAISGNAWDFNGTQVPMTFASGNPGATLPLSGSPVVSDWITYALDHTKTFTIATHGNFSSGDTIRTSGGVSPGGTTMFYYTHTASDETSVSTPTGYSGSAGVSMVSKIEVQ